VATDNVIFSSPTNSYPCRRYKFGATFEHDPSRKKMSPASEVSSQSAEVGTRSLARAPQARPRWRQCMAIPPARRASRIKPPGRSLSRATKTSLPLRTKAWRHSARLRPRVIHARSKPSCGRPFVSSGAQPRCESESHYSRDNYLTEKKSCGMTPRAPRATRITR